MQLEAAGGIAVRRRLLLLGVFLFFFAAGGGCQPIDRATVSLRVMRCDQFDTDRDLVRGELGGSQGGGGGGAAAAPPDPCIP